MYRVYGTILLSLVASLSACYTLAQTIAFQKLGLKEGLSETSVLAIEQDHLKRMWFGTRNGLNCWDGVQMKSFFPERGDSASLMEHKVRDLLRVDRYLWVQTAGGVSRLDLQTFSFQRFYLEGVLCIGRYNHNVLVGSEQGLLVYNEQKEVFLSQNDLYQKRETISRICQDQEGTLWLINGKENHLIKIKNGNREIIKIPFQVSIGTINDVLSDSKNRIWITSENHGIIIYDVGEKKFDFISKNTSPFYLKDLSVRSVVEDKNGKIWVGTFKGLAIFDIKNRTTSFVEAGKGLPHGLSHNSVYPLFISHDDHLWAGTYFGGVNYAKVANQVFTEYNESLVGANPSFPVIGSLIEDDKKNIWVATEGAGLDYFDRQENKFINYPFANNKHGVSQTNVKSLLLTDEEQLLVGTYKGGLCLFDIPKKEFKHFNESKYKNAPQHVNAIIKHKDDFLLATERGLIKFNLDDEAFSPFFESVAIQKRTGITISNVFEDSKGIIWMGSELEGLFSYHPGSKQLNQYLYEEFNESSIAYNSINYMAEDRQHRLWVGTDGGGLCLYDRKKDEFKTFNKKRNNLPSDFIYSIKESGSGDLWIATSKGLSYLDVEKMIFLNYDSKSGFPLTELNYKSLLRSNEGEIFVGGIDGLISFKEGALLRVSKDRKVIFSGLTVNNKPIRANDGTFVLEKDISATESFTLKPEHTTFRLDFSTCNFDRTLKNKYQYKLEGFEEVWVNAEYQTFASYTNLNPGKYTFKVRGTDIAYAPVTEVAVIHIFVEPPISQTGYAYALYFLIVLSLIFLFNYFYISRLRLLYQLENERKEKERIRELNLHKLRFFTNISHEFMTPLTIILSSLENIIQKTKTSSEIGFLLKFAVRNAKRLKYLNRELLDFRKLEQGHLKIKFQEHNIVSYLEDVYQAFMVIASRKNIKYSFVKNVENLPVYYDPTQMDKVFYNLLSNAFDHVADQGGEVILKLEDKANEVEICVMDNGVGIPKEKVKNIFDRFYQLETKFTGSEYSGSGIGLALVKSLILAHRGEITCASAIDKGTGFTVRLLKGEDHLRPEEISGETVSNQFSMDKELVWVGEQEDFKCKVAANKTRANTNKPSLLIADDNWEIRLLINNIFSDVYHVEFASNGQEGLEKALEIQPAIIISDVKMPRLSGLDMCKRLKRSINTSHIPIVLLTALGGEEDKILGLKYGADTYCTKPFSSKMLKAQVENLFNNRKILQQTFSNDLKTKTSGITQNSVDQDFMKRAQELIEKQVTNADFSIDDFASEMGFSRTLFYHKIKTLTGQTPNDFIQTVRLKKAANMLLYEKNKNISEVAFDTGFNTPRYFSKCFKEHFGVSPTEYIKQNRQPDE
ncbi:two-component regulator propeller domain-containing protein [Rapidithrix thailandica]|uniref:histidine kinase n=1 Tax=Rapidithrix thailandica TaxID=413964 RepID=A0AAW9SCA1_9BACT